MRHDFKTEFLVCLDLSQDVNYVVGRAPNMEGARDLARKARTIFPDDKVYITKEMVLRQSLGQLSPSVFRQKVVAANPETKIGVKSTKCKCGKRAGQCVGRLGCQCNPIAMCKKADKWETNPLDDGPGDLDESDNDDDDDEMEDFDVEEDFEFEDDEESEDGEYVNNPEELEEEDLEEEYETNPDEADDEDDGDDEDYQDNPDEDDDEGEEDEDEDEEDDCAN